jgi:peptidoglycan/xylan/chitin deacetylase (PgdA/CDA1 family)
MGVLVLAGLDSSATSSLRPQSAPGDQERAVPLPVLQVAVDPDEQPVGGRNVVPLIARDGPLPATATLTPTATPTPESEPILYLTLDDGPHPTYTVQILDTLERYGARATFFMVGTNVDTYPHIAARVVAAGHVVANQSYSHPQFSLLTQAEIEDQLSRAQTAIWNATGTLPTCMRPPYGTVSATVRDAAASLGLDVWLWTVDPRDWSRPGVAAIVDNVIANAGPGSVVLMHDGGGDRSQTVAALDQILSHFSGRNYRFLPLPC